MASAKNMIYHKLLDHCTYLALNHAADINIDKIITEFTGDSMQTFKLCVEFEVSQKLTDGSFEMFTFAMQAYYDEAELKMDEVKAKVDVYFLPKALSESEKNVQLESSHRIH
ncbi:hypothetical protein AB6D66_26945 [Vibrio pomeroyi]|uniref:Uncharacterized protein n=1 Tax=Vibrio pomeroyi TaxID=198832 RepID=A0ABV4N5G4_9VIBR